MNFSRFASYRVRNSVREYSNVVQEVPQRTKLWNFAVAGVCCSFIGSVYYFSVTKLKKGSEDIAMEIELHEANLTAARKAKNTAPVAQAQVPEAADVPRKKWFGLF